MCIRDSPWPEVRTSDHGWSTTTMPRSRPRITGGRPPSCQGPDLAPRMVDHPRAEVQTSGQGGATTVEPRSRPRDTGGDHRRSRSRPRSTPDRPPPGGPDPRPHGVQVQRRAEQAGSPVATAPLRSPAPSARNPGAGAPSLAAAPEVPDVPDRRRRTPAGPRRSARHECVVTEQSGRTGGAGESRARRRRGSAGGRSGGCA